MRVRHQSVGHLGDLGPRGAAAHRASDTARLTAIIRAATRLVTQFSRKSVRGICRRVATKGTSSRRVKPSQVSAARSRALCELTSATRRAR